MKRVMLVVLVLLATPTFASATLTFQQLDGNTFTISHMVKWIGGRGQAMDLVYEKAASLCIAAGYTHMKVLDQESNANGFYQNANATVTVKFFLETGEERVACDMKASDEYIEQAKKKLQKRDYEGPVVTDEAADAQESENHCTVEQISAMVKAGLSEDQINAACSKAD